MRFRLDNCIVLCCEQVSVRGGVGSGPAPPPGLLVFAAISLRDIFLEHSIGFCHLHEHVMIKLFKKGRLHNI